MSKFIKRLLSVFLISGFFLQEISFAALPTAQIATASYINISDAVANPLRLDTPFQYVTVKEAFSGGSGKLLIHIQDAHTNLSGQQNLAGALDYLMSRYRGLSEVFVEGASTDVTLNGIKKIIAVERIGLAAKRFLQDGVIAGEEYLNLTSDHPMKIQGVEDEALSKESLIAYADLKAQREEVLSYLEIIGASLSLLKSHFYPQEILVYEKIKGSGEKTGGMSAEFGSLLRLQELAGISLNEYAELAKLKDLRDTEKKIDFDKANLEQMALGEALARKGASQVLSEYSKAQAGSRKTQTAQYMFLENILGLAVKHNIATKEYPELMRYRGYLEAFTKIRLDQALDEMQLLEERAYQTVLSRNEAVKIHAIERFIDLLTKAYQIKLTSKEFDLLVSNESLFPTSGWEAFLNDKLIETGRGDHLIAYKDSLEKNLRFIRRFYKLVEDRDMAFVENASSWMDKDSAKAAFLITGGYHTQHLAELMRQKNISYIVLTPYVTSETNQEKYEKLLLLGLDADRQRKAVQQNTTTNKKDKNSDEAFTRRVEAFGEAGELRLAAVYPKEVPILLAPEVKDLNQFLAAAKLAQSDVMRRASSASLSGAKLANADQAAVDLFKVYDAITILDDNNAKFLRATVLDLSDLTPSPIGKIAPTLSSIGVNIDGKYSVTLNDLRLEIGDKLIPIVARRYAEELNDQESEQLLSVTREAETAIRSRVAEIFGSKSISFDFVSAMKRTFVRKLLQKILLSKSQIQTFNQLFDQERRKQKAIREATNLKDSQKPLREWDRLYRELPTYFLKTYYTEETLNRDYSLSGAWDSLDNAMSRNSDNYEQDMNYDVLTSRTPKQLLIPDKVEFSRRLVKFADSLTEIVKKRELYVFALAMALQFNLGQDLQNDLVSKISQIDRAAAQPSSVTAAKLASGSAGETASSVERDASSVVRDASSDSLSGAKLAEVKLKRFDLVQSRDALVSHLSSVLPAKTADGKVIDVSALRVFNESIISPAYAGLINLDLQGSQWVLALFAPRMREPRVFFYSVSLAMGEINPSYQVRRIARSLLMDTAVEGMGPGAFTDAAGGGSEYVDMRLITPIFGGEPFLALYFQTGVLKDGDKGKVVSKYSRGVFSVLGAADDVSWGDQRFVQPDEGLHLERAPSNVYRLFVSAPNDLLNTPERICLITTGQAPTGARLATPGQETAGKLADKLDSIADQYIPSDTYSTDNARDFLKTAVGRLRRYHTGDPQHSHLLRQSQDQIERALYGDPDSTDTVINDIVRNILSGNPDAVDFLRRRYGDKKGLKRIADDNLPLKQYPVRLPDNRKIFVAGLDAEFICKYVINVFDLLIQVRDLAIRMEPDGAKLATVQPVQYLGGVNINSVYGQLNFKIVEAIEVRRVMIEIERMCSQLRVEFAQLKMQTVRHGEKVIDVRRESETLLLPITFLHVSVNLLGAKLASMPSRPLDGAAIRQALTDLESASVCLKVIETLAQKKGAVKVFDGKAMWESQGRLPADVVTVRDRVLACATLLRYGIAQASYELVRMRDAGEAPGNASITIFLLLAGIAQDFGISLENLERKIQEEEGPVGLDIALLLRQTQMAISSTEKVTGIFEAMVTGAKLAGAQRAAAAYSWTAQQPVKYTSDTAGRTQWLADWLKNTTGATPAWQEHFTRFAKAGYAITVVSSAAGMVQISLSIPASNGSSGISPGRAIAVVRTVPIDNPLVAKEMNEVCTNLGHMTSAPDSAAEQNAIMASMRRLAGYFEDPRIMLEALADRQLANWVDNRLSGDREGYEEVLDEEWIDGKPRPSSMRMDTEGIIQGVLNQTIGFKHGSFYQAATSTDAAPRAIPADLMRRQTVQLYTDYGSPIYQTANGQRIDMITPLVKILFSRHYVDLAQTVDRPQLRTSLPD